MALTRRPEPSKLVSELAVVLRSGLRASRVLAFVRALPALTELCCNGCTSDTERAISIVQSIEVSLASLGDGPYGRCAQALFGNLPLTRGLLLPQRRNEAAEQLGVTRATLVRHWEGRIVLDVAVSLLAIQR